MAERPVSAPLPRPVRVPVPGALLEADLTVPDGVGGVVVFAHGSGSSRHSPRNRAVAEALQRCELATLLLDLLTVEEAGQDAHDGHLRFDIALLAQRLEAAADWLAAQPETAGLPLGCFGASTGGGAALAAAAHRPDRFAAVVSRGGRPDLAGDALPRVRAATLLVVGGADEPVLSWNHEAAARMTAPVRVAVVPGAGHLFSGPGELEQVVALAADWFARRLRGASRAPAQTATRRDR